MNRACLCAFMGCVLFAAPKLASAALIDWPLDPTCGSAEDTGSTALFSMSLSESGGDHWLTLRIENTTPDSIGSRLTAVAFELPDFLNDTPTFAGGGTSTYFDTIDYDVSLPQWFLSAPGGYDVVISSDGNFLGGNPNGAPRGGESQTVTLNLGDTGHSTTDLGDAMLEWYADHHDLVAVGRFQSVGPNGNLSDIVAYRVPEPATVVMLAGTGGIIALRRRCV